MIQQHYTLRILREEEGSDVQICMPPEGRISSRRSLEERMDYLPPRQTRSYHQYNNSSQGYSRSRSIDNRAKQHSHREQEQLEYDDSTPAGFNMEDIYEEQQKNEGPNKNLEDRISNSMPDQDYNGDASPGANEDIDQNESNSTNGNQRILGSSKVRATITVYRKFTKFRRRMYNRPLTMKWRVTIKNLDI